MNPIDLTIAQLLGKPSPKVEWLLRVGPIAKQLNQESEADGAGDRSPAPLCSNDRKVAQ